jgi:hypothetical protein
MDSYSSRQQLAQLRLLVKEAQEEKAQAEAELESQIAEIRRLERRIQLRVGRLIERLARIEDEIDRYQTELLHYRSPDREALESGYLPVEEQYRRTWEVPRDDPVVGPEQVSSMDKKQFKRLYRQLARRFHPDLARDEGERDIRTERMAALNEAYESGSLIELVALANEPAEDSSGPGEITGAGTDIVKVLEKELNRLRRQTLLLQNEIENLHNLPIVQLSLEIKMASRHGRDLLAEIAADLKGQIARKTVERDDLKAQLDQYFG